MGMRLSDVRFTAGIVGNSAIEMLLAAAVRAPTAFHEVPWRFLMVQECSTLSRISDRAKEMSADQIAHLHQTREHHLDIFSQLEISVFYNSAQDLTCRLR